MRSSNLVYGQLMNVTEVVVAGHTSAVCLTFEEREIESPNWNGAAAASPVRVVAMRVAVYILSL